MMVVCAHCKRAFPREDFRVTRSDDALLWTGQRVQFVRHRGSLRRKGCEKKTIMPANAALGPEPRLTRAV